MIQGLYQDKPYKPLRAKKPLSRSAGIHRGGKRLQRPLSIDSGAPKQYRPGLKAQLALKRVGKRGKRLLAGDRAQEAATHKLPCVCGACPYSDPDAPRETGTVARAHLERRAIESTRNEDWNNLPGCLALNHWLDQESNGVHAKAQLLEMARKKRKRLTPEEVQPILWRFDYYGWKASQGPM
jgi:hypothetical protein